MIKRIFFAASDTEKIVQDTNGKWFPSAILWSMRDQIQQYCEESGLEFWTDLDENTCIYDYIHRDDSVVIMASPFESTHKAIHCRMHNGDSKSGIFMLWTGFAGKVHMSYTPYFSLMDYYEKILMPFEPMMFGFSGVSAMATTRSHEEKENATIVATGFPYFVGKVAEQEELTIENILLPVDVTPFSWKEVPLTIWSTWCNELDNKLTLLRVGSPREDYDTKTKEGCDKNWATFVELMNQHPNVRVVDNIADGINVCDAFIQTVATCPYQLMMLGMSISDGMYPISLDLTEKFEAYNYTNFTDIANKLRFLSSPPDNFNFNRDIANASRYFNNYIPDLLGEITRDRVEERRMRIHQ